MTTETVAERVSAKARERVLNYFIDPQNPLMGYQEFARNLLNMYTGSNPTDAQKAMADILMNLEGDVSNARKFDETYLGHMLSEACIPAMWAYMLAIRLGGNTVAREVSEMESRLEPEAIRGLMEIVGYNPDKASGTFTSGGSMANFTALNVAVKRIKRDFEVAGKQIDKPLVVLVNPFAHYSFHKDAEALAGPSRMLEKIPVETIGFKMDPNDLEKKIKELLGQGKIIASIFAIAGETETGLVDPLSDIADVAEKYQIFTIADGAFGAPYRLSRNRHLFDGLNRFSAVVIDAHKALYTPYGAGAALFKNKEDHVLLNLGVRAPYVKFEESEEALLASLAYKSKSPSMGVKRFEGSMGAGAILSTVAVLRTLGLEGLSTVYDVTLDNIEYFYDLVSKSDVLMPIHEPDLNLLCFRIRPEIESKFGLKENAARSKIVEESRTALDNGIVGDGGYFFSSTDFNLPNTTGQMEPVSVWRACLMNPRTDQTILRAAVKGLEEEVMSRLKKTQT